MKTGMNTKTAAIAGTVLLAVLAFGLLSGCAPRIAPPPGPDEYEEDIQHIQSQSGLKTNFSKEEVVGFLKSDSSYPDDFYQENLTLKTLIYETTYSIIAPEERDGKLRELCTDDAGQAREWSEAASAHGQEGRQLIGERETVRFFEFARVKADRAEQPAARRFVSRIHKCSYVDRSAYEIRDSETVRGRITGKILTGDEFRELIEYLWFIDNHNRQGSKVLSSFIDEDGTTPVMYETRVSYSFKGCDTVKLYRSEYRIEEETGIILRARQLVETFYYDCPDPVFLDIGSTFVLKAGNGALIPSESLQVWFLNVSEDSRCPIGARCVLPGQITIDVLVAKNRTTIGRGTITTGVGKEDRTELSIGGYRIILLKIVPYPEAGKAINPAEYVATMTVERSS